MFLFLKKNKNLIISFCVIYASLLFLVTRFVAGLGRFISSLADFGASIANYFLFLFRPLVTRIFGAVPTINNTIANVPNINLKKYASFNINELTYKLSNFNEALFDATVFSDFSLWFMNVIKKGSVVVLTLIMVFLLLFYAIGKMFLKENDKEPGEKSVAYTLYCFVMEKIFSPAWKLFKDFVSYFWERKVFRYSFIVVWLIAFNLLTFVVGFFAFYFYFISSFNVLSFKNLIVRFFADLIITFNTVPFWLLIITVFAVLIYRFVDLGYKELRHMEAKNCGFLKTTDYLLLIKGPPGAGKTTLSTDFALSWVNIQKTDAYDEMLAMEMMFPAFSYANLRRDLDSAIESREIFCIPCCDIFVDKLFTDSSFPYGYNSKLFAIERNTGTGVVKLLDAVKIYAQAYFVYINDNSVMANYPIRFDGKFDSSEHLKKWDGDFFKDRGRSSRYARILDQDVLRMGKKMYPHNKFNGTFGYGIYVNTEWGKTRGNKLTTEDVNKKDKIANQKNDLYSYALKMCRHACSTIDNKVFFRFIGDEQRPESLSADQRELCSILEIVDKSEIKLVLPFADLIDLSYKKFYEPFVAFYTDYSNKRSDEILSVMLYKFAVAAVSRIYKYIYNTFGYFELDLSMEKGAEYGEANNGEKKIHKYYLMCKKVYNRRYNTDCHSAYFTKMQLAAGIGMIDYPTYQNLRMTTEEMDAQHDYFINEWQGIINVKDNYVSSKTTTVQESEPEFILEL